MTRGSSAPTDDERELTARHASLAEAASFAHRFCTRHRIDRSLELKLALVLEELIANTVEHGFGVDSDAPIRVALRASDAGGVSVLYEDTAPRFDPLAHDAGTPAGVDDPFDARPLGGLGIHLVGRLVTDARYAYEDGRNRLWLTLRNGADSSTV